MEETGHYTPNHGSLPPLNLDPIIAVHARQYRQAPSHEEIARRQAAWAAFVNVRDEIGPVDVNPTDLLREAREEDDRVP
ncbi:MAG: hypothetical protein NTZ05_16595 [Chloroflexi bacterium]|nr:hypothetical protein [Chloroflexota bacterium]